MGQSNEAGAQLPAADNCDERNKSFGFSYWDGRGARWAPQSNAHGTATARFTA